MNDAHEALADRAERVKQILERLGEEQEQPQGRLLDGSITGLWSAWNS